MCFQEWEVKENYYFLEDDLYTSAKENIEKLAKESLEDAKRCAKDLLSLCGILPKEIKLFLCDYKGLAHCTYYYFVITDFLKKDVEKVFFSYAWFSLEEVLEKIRANAFCD